MWIKAFKHDVSVLLYDFKAFLWATEKKHTQSKGVLLHVATEVDGKKGLADLADAQWLMR